jgi:predicted DNA-binding ribbon-helix-helix protein
MLFIQRSGLAKALAMKSVVIKRSVLTGGRKTSVSLENEFWDGLRVIADRESVSLSKLVQQIDRERNNINLSSAIRVFVFTHFRFANENNQM